MANKDFHKWCFSLLDYVLARWLKNLSTNLEDAAGFLHDEFGLSYDWLWGENGVKRITKWLNKSGYIDFLSVPVKPSKKRDGRVTGKTVFLIPKAKALKKWRKIWRGVNNGEKN